MYCTISSVIEILTKWIFDLFDTRGFPRVLTSLWLTSLCGITEISRLLEDSLRSSRNRISMVAADHTAKRYPIDKAVTRGNRRLGKLQGFLRNQDTRLTSLSSYESLIYGISFCSMWSATTIDIRFREEHRLFSRKPLISLLPGKEVKNKFTQVETLY